MELLNLTIESATGTIEHKYNANEPVKAVKISAMGQLHLDPSTAGNFVLLFNGVQLDENKTLEELKIPNGATLRLAPLKTVVI
jgi:hypothetical protein